MYERIIILSFSQLLFMIVVDARYVMIELSRGINQLVRDDNDAVTIYHTAVDLVLLNHHKLQQSNNDKKNKHPLKTSELHFYQYTLHTSTVVLCDNQYYYTAMAIHSIVSFTCSQGMKCPSYSPPPSVVIFGRSLYRSKKNIARELQTIYYYTSRGGSILPLAYSRALQSIVPSFLVVQQQLEVCLQHV